MTFHILEHSFGITDSALALMKLYLDGRQQCAQIERVISAFVELACGVPQGSVLRQLKLCIYMLPIGLIMRHHNIYFHIYADDTQINDSKTEFLIMTSLFLKQSFDDLNIMVGDSNIVSSNSVRNRGVIFDKCMKLDYHICSVCKSTYFHLCNIGSIRSILSNDACAQLIHSLVTVRLDYCNSILYGLLDNSLYRLPRFSHISATLFDLHQLPIRNRITFKMCIIT